MTKRFNLERSTLWSLSWYGLKTAFRFISNMILTRLLSPEMFGVAAIGNAILNGLSMFSDIGLTQGVTRSTREDADFYRTAWTLQLLRGVLLLLILLLLAEPIGAIYDSSAVTTFLLIVAFSQLAMGLNNIEVLRDYKTAELRRVALIDIAAAIVGLTIMVLWALQQPSHVALAMGALCSTATFTVLTWFCYPRAASRFRLERASTQEMLQLGKWIFISTILAFFIVQMDRLALGKLVALEWVGYYSIAWIWATIPSTMLAQWSSQVFFPLVAQTLAQGRGLAAVRTTRRAYVAICVLASVVLYGASELLVAVLYPDKYAAVAALMRPLVAVSVIGAVEHAYSDLLVGFGIPKEKILGQLLSVVFFLALLWPVFTRVGIEGVIYLLGVASTIRLLWSAWRLHPHLRQDLVFDALLFLVFLVCAQALFALNQLAPNLWVEAALVAVQAALACPIAYGLYKRVRSLHAVEAPPTAPITTPAALS
jgi:O-antigen/teichoic acid export membrane protein